MLYVFGDYTLDTRRDELRHAGALIPLDYQVFQVLAYLLAHPDRVIPRQELFEQLWLGRFVSDAALERCITLARRALGDSGHAQRSIKTIHGRGYRCVAIVEARPDTALQPLEPNLSMSHPPLPQPPVLLGTSVGVWEQKPVAVLAIELTWPDQTASNALGDEPWTVTTAWQHSIVEKIQWFGGVVLQRAPALLMVAFGMPQTLEQLPQRAVQAALTIRQLVTAPPDDGPCPEVRLVGHWGPLLVEVQATDPPGPLRALGETLAWPVRLLEQAAAGEILVSKALGALVEGWYELAAREVLLGGQSLMPTRVYTVVGRKPQETRLEVLRHRPLSRFVGRSRELATLRALMDQVLEGRGQVVGMVGEPGMGKSRVCYEDLQRYLRPPWSLWEMRAVGYGQAIPYLPIIDLLKADFQLDDHDQAHAIREKVVASLLAVDAGLQPTLPAFLTLLDVPVEDSHWQALAPPQRRQRLLDAVKHLILRVSQTRPVLLIVENLHWIDTETQACLDRLVESLPTARLLLLVTYRPEYQHGWGHKTYYTSLRLDPLSRVDVQTLLNTLLGDEGRLAPLKRRVLVRTQGNPFFVEESVQSLIETGGVVGGPGAYRLGTPSQTLQVPATVQAVLAARIDRLPAEARHLLQTAAVIGAEVPVPLLQAVAGLDEERLYRGLAQLQAAEFLYEMWRVPEPAYTFKHALTQEVVYGSLVQGRRRVLHTRIVAALEALPGDQETEQIERLAHHALRGEVWDKALAYCRQAGEKAMARSAYREAVGYFEQALSALPHLPETRDTREQAIDLRLALRTAILPSGDVERIMELLHETEALTVALDDPRRLGRVSSFLAFHFFMIGAHDQAIAAGERALVLATASGEVVLQAQANMNLGYAYLVQGAYRRAIDCFGHTVASLGGARRYEQFGADILPPVIAYARLAVCHAELGTFAEGRSPGEEGLRIAEAVGHPASVMWAAWGVGLLILRQGDLQGALPWLERAMGMCQDADLRIYFAQTAVALGTAYTLAGRLADAMPLLTQAMEQSAAAERAIHKALCGLSLGVAQRLAGRLEEAHALAEQALALARARQERGNEAYTLRLLGDIAARCEPPESLPAESYYRQALALAEELGMRPLQAHCHLGLGTLYAKTGRREHAHTELSSAIDLYRAMEMTFCLSRAKAELAKTAGSDAARQGRTQHLHSHSL